MEALTPTKDHPLFSETQDTSRSEGARRAAWDRLEHLRDIQVNGAIGAMWLESVQSGRLPLARVPREHVGFVTTHLKTRVPELIGAHSLPS